jgi:hypothetical protein
VADDSLGELAEMVGWGMAFNSVGENMGTPTTIGAAPLAWGASIV